MCLYWGYLIWHGTRRFTLYQLLHITSTPATWVKLWGFLTHCYWRSGCRLKLTILVHIKDSYLDHFLWNFAQVHATRIHWWLVGKFFQAITEPMLTLNVRGPSYLGLTRSISWLLMPWLLTSPGLQQPWYWPNRICRSYSYSRKCFKYLCQINVEEWHKMQIHVYVPSEKIST